MILRFRLSSTTPQKIGSQTIGRNEFVIMIATMFATTAFSIDALLPAMPAVAADIAPDAPTHVAWVLTAFMIGLGCGTFFTGPLSDAFGRKPIIYAGCIVYVLAAIGAWMTSSLEWMLVARVVQGLGASGPRIVSLAIIRDLYSGPQMARIISIAMIIFITVPAIAPAMGDMIIRVTGWRAIFGAFIVFSLASTLWMGLRLNETLATTDRRPMRWALMFSAIHEMLTHKTVLLAIIAQTLVMVMLFTTLTMIQPIYDISFERGDSFPYWFGMIALLSGSSSLLNAVIVTRFGMRTVVTWALRAQLCLGLVLIVTMTSNMGFGFPLFLLWQFGLFCQAGLTVGNLNAIAMQPMGHIAGMAASVIGGISTVLGALIASPLGLLFDGTPMPLIVVVAVTGTLCLALMNRMRRLER